MLHGVHFISCVVLSLQKICVPCIDVIFTSTSTTSTGSQHLKYPCRKLHSGWSKQAILKYTFLILILIYTISCISVSKLNHVIPCLIITWKINGSLLINLLTLILSHILIAIILGNSILLSLKVTVTSFQSISSVSHKKFLFNFIFLVFSVPLILKQMYTTCCFT